MPNKKWAVNRLTVNLAQIEYQYLSEMCETTGRPATDIIRESIRLMHKQMKDKDD